MIVSEIGKNVIVFRDTFSVNLIPEITEEYKLVSSIVDFIFKHEQVLVADPIVTTNHCGSEITTYITVKVESIPLTSHVDVDDLTQFLKSINGVRFAQANWNYPPSHAEIKEHLYGGKRSKL